MSYHRRVVVRHLEETEAEIDEAREHLAVERRDFGERLERVGRHPSQVEFERLVGVTEPRSDGYAPIPPNPLEIELQRLLGEGDAGCS